MIIREMTWDDLEAVTALDRENFDPAEQWSGNGFLTHLLREDTVYLVAEEDGRLLGYAGMITSFTDGDITKLSVRTACRRQGIGRALLAGMIAGAQEKKVTDIYLEVRESNAAAIGLYETYGFRRIGVRRRYYLNPPEDALLMQYTTKKENPDA